MKIQISCDYSKFNAWVKKASLAVNRLGRAMKLVQWRDENPKERDDV